MVVFAYPKGYRVKLEPQRTCSWGCSFRQNGHDWHYKPEPSTKIANGRAGAYSHIENKTYGKNAQRQTSANTQGCAHIRNTPETARLISPKQPPSWVRSQTP